MAMDSQRPYVQRCNETDMDTNPCRISEDDGLRSRHMRRLIQGVIPTASYPPAATIPKVVIQFWHDSNNIPSDVRECLDSWKRLDTQGFKRIFFDDGNARRFISKSFGHNHVAAFDRCPHPAMRCDYFRLCYILRNGGFYVDADEFYQGGDCDSLFQDDRLKIQPLCYDVASAAMVPYDEFTRQHGGAPNWIFYVNNNPLVAPASHPVVRLALRRSTRILLNDEGRRGDIQSTTGPGNLTASLVRHAIVSELGNQDRDFSLIANWEAISISRWPLSYRSDDRNWRLWNHAQPLI